MTGRLMISAGEASGDAHGAALARSLTRLDPELAIFGMGGPAMAGAGVELIADASAVSVTGVAEVVPVLGRILSTLRRLKQALRRERPTALVVIDLPDFNFRLAAAANKIGIPVIYYIVPQIWAWRRSRVKLLQRWFSKLIVILPFEAEWYRARGLKAEYAGHPLAEFRDPDDAARAVFLGELGLDSERPVLALLPGSRGNELERHLPLLREAALILRAERPELQFALPVAPGRDPEPIGTALQDLEVSFIDGRARDLLACSRAALVCSGTATLEAALSRCPMVMFYRISPLSYFLRHFFSTVETFSLPNLIAGEDLVTELIQEEATPERLVAEILPLLDETPKRSEMLAGLGRVKELVGGPGCSDRAAGIIIQSLGATLGHKSPEAVR